MPMIGLDGKPLFAKAPAGFYLAGHCPVCEEPIFYHGDGAGYLPGTAMQPAASVPVDMKLYQFCECQIEDMELRLPKEYDILQERGSLDLLFEFMAALRGTFLALQVAHRDAVEQIRELMEEREQHAGDPQPG